ncbi:hypothetical protein O7627_19395 [Solwaraspora sp. WMMD1047]|uniref:hypothetical protein n=1 Tax=Solwaraspora sp. WMMD1047 TaxID=3016102 RepID=UPI002415AB40|nr:hypothetical protein [Solwaraspora sp. WMMD1047]MDG4831466.1 hypothetical protein [Solwaraspora sp. WMMD1047]
MIAFCLGGAAALWQLSPWRSQTGVGNALFWVATAAFAALLVGWLVRGLLSLSNDFRIVEGFDLLKGSYLDRIVDIGRAVMGDGHADVDTLRLRLGRYSQGVKVLVRRPQRLHVREAVVGYLASWTISASASARYLSGEYRSGLDLQEEDIVSVEPEAVYVTMVYGSDITSRYEILKITLEHLMNLFGRVDMNGPKHLLARPATPEGERIMRKIGMKPLKLDGSDLWIVGREQLLMALESSRR